MIMLRIAVILALLTGSAQAQMWPFPGPGRAAVGGVTCSSSQGNAFLARTSGLNNTDKTNYCTLIDGLETDGVGCSNTLSALWILAAPDITGGTPSATTLLNLCSTSYSLTQVGSGTATASQGWAGNGSTGYFTTAMIPNAAPFGATWSNASAGFYIRNNRTTNNGQTPLGGTGAGIPNFYTIPLQAGQFQYSFFGDTSVFPAPTNTPGTVQGAWSMVRTAASGTNSLVYRNGSSTALFNQSNPNSSGVVGGVQLFIGAQNNNGTAAQFSQDQIAAVWYGLGLTGTNAAAVQNRVNAFMTAYGTNVY